MKMLSTILLMIFVTVYSALFNLEIRQNCCVEITNVKSPVKRVVFKTIAGKEICVDPETAWVSGHVDKVSKRTTTHTLMQILITYN
uniref:Chemokine interleukin-8-like domain-containing protein n=1 Tax=Cyprinus carpio TaxID=7962 RepID=A0A8C1UY37_CYPCA